MGYRIDVRKDGTIIDSFEIAAEFVVELLTWRSKNIPPVTDSPEEQKSEVTAPRAAEKTETRKRDEHGKKIRVCSNCHKPGHRSDTCPHGDGSKLSKDGRTRGQEALMMPSHGEMDEVNASAFIRIRAKHKQGNSDEDIMDDENVTLGQLKAVLEATSWARYHGRFAH